MDGAEKVVTLFTANTRPTLRRPRGGTGFKFGGGYS